MMTEEKLVRGLGRWDFTAIVINTIIGAGIFGLPAKSLRSDRQLQPDRICRLRASSSAFIVLCYAEVSSRFSATGGPYLYAKRRLVRLVGFEVGWLYWIVRVTTFAANCNLLVTYLGFFFPAANEGCVADRLYQSWSSLIITRRQSDRRPRIGRDDEYLYGRKDCCRC